MGKKLTTETFIEKAKLIHGDKYDYSLVEYIDKRHKVKIICPVHGEFEQQPNYHYSGSGCKRCLYSSQESTTEEFIEKAKVIHHNKYNYSLVNYINAKTKVIIICPTHGEFEQIPGNHLKGCGCQKCAGKNKTTEYWINEAKIVHGDKYNYSLVNYINAKTKVIIICPVHGEFEQVAASHLRGNGCFKCYGTKKYTTEIFIEKAKLIHGDKYNYSSVEYIDKRHKVKIICPAHGEFEQVAGEHIRGCGCLDCSESKGEKEVAKILTEMNVEFKREYKFKDCRNINPLPFDFYIPSINTAVEFQGIQHYESIKAWGGEKIFKNIQKRDQIKKEYCVNNNIPLIIISHTEFDNIKSILSTNLTYISQSLEH